MDTTWWLALVAVLLLALVATLVDGWGRGHRQRRSRRLPHSAGELTGRPRPGDIWWAEPVPCLVLAVRDGRATVARITGHGEDGRPELIPLPGGVLGEGPRFLDPGELYEVPVGDLRHRVGQADPALWDRVRHLAG
ncbi:type II toxin-antitoxin system PemK/MazF family toxin [Streptomyces sp. NPDC004286]|uniref:type II toxin-antitoxin system PemK/MazF family toxin n=1 Tax=Streptomyces sp. NPDC004286 TaxID=3364696 RepID=UPI0036AF8BE0